MEVLAVVGHDLDDLALGQLFHRYLHRVKPVKLQQGNQVLLGLDKAPSRKDVMPHLAPSSKLPEVLGLGHVELQGA